MRRTSISIVLLALLAACGEAPTAPARPAPTTPRLAVGSAENGAVVQHNRSEQSIVGIVGLCGSTEPVDLEATLRTRVQTVFPASGGSRHTVHLNVQLRGTGVESGLQYVGHETLNEVAVYPDGFGGAPATRMWNVRVHIARQGSADDLSGMIHMKRTINANGVVTVEFEIVEGDCVS